MQCLCVHVRACNMCVLLCVPCVCVCACVCLCMCAFCLPESATSFRFSSLAHRHSHAHLLVWHIPTKCGEKYGDCSFSLALKISTSPPPPHDILRLSFLSFHTFGGWDYATTSTTKQAHRTHIHTYININIYIHTSICTHIYTQAHKLTHTNICVYISERDGEEGRFERYLADHRRAQITKKTVISMK